MSSRNWCWTLNNYTDEDLQKIGEWDCKYLVYGKEKGENNTPHLQGYVEFEGSKKLTTLKKLHEKIHWETRKGSRDEAINYCKKDKNTFEKGMAIKTQGKRNDLVRIKQMVKDGKNTKDIWDEAPSFQAMKMAEIGLKLYEEKRSWKPEVFWFCGPTGTGKTKKAFEMAVNPWVSGRNLKWWEGYDGHADVIIDDFRGDFCTFHELLRILDRYEYRIETKGGSRQLRARRIWLTSCKTPFEVYPNVGEDVAQLIRRIDHLEYFAQKLEQGAEVQGNTIEPGLQDNIEEIDL